MSSIWLVVCFGVSSWLLRFISGWFLMVVSLLTMFEVVSFVMSSRMMVRFVSVFVVKICWGDCIVMGRCCHVLSWFLVVKMLSVIRDVNSGSI